MDRKKIGWLLLATLLVITAITYFQREEDTVPETVAADISIFTDFQKVENACADCGTNSPVGEWVDMSGNRITFFEDGDYEKFFNDGSTEFGHWERQGQWLQWMCFRSSQQDDQECVGYQQRVDALKLNDTIFIRR